MKRWICLKLWHLFWRTLCPRPDRTRLESWWYHRSAVIASFFYRAAHGIPKRQQAIDDQVSLGEAWGIFLIILMLLVACVSVGADIYLNLVQQ